jgi:hypothetical protein
MLREWWVEWESRDAVTSCVGAYGKAKSDVPCVKGQPFVCRI